MGAGVVFFVILQPLIATLGYVQDQTAIYVHAIEVLAEVPDDLLHLPLYRHHAIPVAVYR
jgi:hypothetical protein